MAGRIGGHVKPFPADGVADLGGQVITFALDGAPFLVAGGRGQFPFDGDQIGGPGVVDVVS